VGLVLFTVGLVLGAVAPSMLALVAARFVQGLGAGALPAIAYVCVARGYPLELRPRMFAVLSTAWVIPGLVGPALAAAVGETWGWRWVFGGLVPIVVAAGALATGAVRRTIPEPLPGEAVPVGAWDGTRDAVLVALAAAVLLAGLGADLLVLGLPAAVLATVLGGRVYRRLTPPGTLRAAPGLPAAIVLRGLLTFTFFAVDAFLPLAIEEVRRRPTAVVAIALTAATLTWTAAAWVQERLVYRVGPRRLVRLGFAGLVGATALIVIGLGETVPIGVLLGGVAVAGFSIGLAYAPISLTVLSEATAGAEGAASSSLQLTDGLGVAIGTGVVGAIVAIGDDLDASLAGALAAGFGLAMVTGVIGALLTARLPTSLRRTDSVPAT
jgi:MFS family permease